MGLIVSASSLLRSIRSPLCVGAGKWPIGAAAVAGKHDVLGRARPGLRECDLERVTTERAALHRRTGIALRPHGQRARACVRAMRACVCVHACVCVYTCAEAAQSASRTVPVSLVQVVSLPAASARKSMIQLSPRILQCCPRGQPPPHRPPAQTHEQSNPNPVYFRATPAASTDAAQPRDRGRMGCMALSGKCRSVCLPL